MNSWGAIIIEAIAAIIGLCWYLYAYQHCAGELMRPVFGFGFRCIS
jgi:hypothetical protein